MTLTLTLPAALASHGLSACEQGGILIGTGHTVTQFTTPGPDDLCQPDLFMLLDDSHSQALEHAGQDYLGSWHSHPPGTPSDPSPEDIEDWQRTADAIFPQQPHVTRLFFVIVTGDRLRAWTLGHARQLKEVSYATR